MKASTEHLEKKVQKKQIPKKKARKVAMEKIQPATENTLNRLNGGIPYEPFLGHTLTSMKTARNLFKPEERPFGDIFWKDRSVEKFH